MPGEEARLILSDTPLYWSKLMFAKFLSWGLPKNVN